MDLLGITISTRNFPPKTNERNRKKGEKRKIVPNNKYWYL